MLNHVVCLKWGTKYSAEYVNRLNSMVERNLTLPYTFVCFTEDTTGIDPKIKCLPLPELALKGWWYKLWFLSEDFPLEGNILFLDLDLIIFENIDNLFKFSPNSFCIIKDFNRAFNPSYRRYNSSVFRYKSKQYHRVFESFYKNHNLHVQRYHGDQDFLYQHIKDAVFWPDEWIQSYKWEMRNRRELEVTNGKRNFATQRDPDIKKNTSIAVFHGEPNIDECKDHWVHRHWR